MNVSEHSDKPIRVMRIIARLNIGGPAIHVALLTAGLQDEAFQSLLVTGSLGKAEGDMSYFAREVGVEPVILPAMRREISPLADIKTFWSLYRLMRTHQPHIVHTHTTKAGILGRFAAVLAGVPVVLHTFHGHAFHSYFGWLKTQVYINSERLAARFSDVIITISDRLKSDLVEYAVAPEAKITVVPLGLPLARLADVSHLRGQFRKEIGCHADTALVGIVGRLVPIKNHDLFLHAARQVKHEHDDVHFVIIGDGERRHELEGMAQALDIEDAVIFTGWRADLDVIYADLDAAVISSRNEGTPVSLIEAMAAGVPVVSTAVGGVPDLLQEGEFGELVPVDDITALANGIIDLLSTKQTARIESARKWVLEQYDSQRLIHDIRVLYYQLLSSAEGLI